MELWTVLIEQLVNGRFVGFIIGVRPVIQDASNASCLPATRMIPRTSLLLLLARANAQQLHRRNSERIIRLVPTC